MIIDGFRESMGILGIAYEIIHRYGYGYEYGYEHDYGYEHNCDYDYGHGYGWSHSVLCCRIVGRLVR